MSSRDVVSSKETPMLSALNLRRFKPLSTAFCRMAWVRSPETQEKIDKLLYVMEYGLRKTESEFGKNS